MVKITGLPSTTDLTGTEVVPVVQAGQTRRTTIDEVLSGKFGVLPSLQTATIAAGAAAQDAKDAIGDMQSALNSQTTISEQALAAVANDIEQAKSEVAGLVAEVHATQTDIAAAQADVAAAQANIQAVAASAALAGDAAAAAMAQIAAEVARAVAAETNMSDNAQASISDARAAIDAAMADANSAIAVAQGQADAARSDAQATADDLADEIERAKADTGSIRQSLVSIHDTIGGVQLNISDEILQRQGADDLLAGRSTTLEQQMAGAQGSFLNTRIANEEFTRTSQNEAMALRTSGIEVSYGAASGAINANPTFTVWPDSQPLPSNWEAWNNGGGVSRISTSRPGYKYALRQSLAANVEGGVAQWSATALTISPGWYVMEAEVSLDSGTWRGAGMTIEGQYGLDFASEPDTNGAASATQTGLRRFSKLVYVDHTLTNWHLMTNWYVFGQMDAKVLTWYRSVLRPASQAEITAKQASVDIGVATARLNSTEFAKTTDTEALAYRAGQLEASRDGINARLNSTEFAKTTATDALAYRAGLLEASVNNPATGVAATTARLNSTEFAKTTATDALAYRAGELEATVNNPATGMAATTARLNSTEFAKTTATEALAYRAGQLEASRDGITARLNSAEFAKTTELNAVASSVSSLSVGSPNLLAIGGFTAGLEGWDYNASGQIAEDLGWGSRFVAFGITGWPPEILSAKPEYWVPVTAGAIYTISADLLIYASTASAYVYVDAIYYNSDRTVVALDGGQTPLYASTDFANSLAKRRAYSFTDTAPAGAAWARVRVVCDPAGGTITAVGARLIKFERGAIATAYSQEAEARQQYLVRKDADSALAYRAGQLEATVNNATTGVAATIARLNSTEFAKTTATDALAYRAGQLEATVNNPATGVAATTARLNSTEFAKTTATDALAYRAGQLEASVNNPTTGVAATTARLNSTEFAKTTALNAVVSSVSSLSVGSPNLISIGGFTAGLEGWNYKGSGVIAEDLGWGPRFVDSAGISGAVWVILSTQPDFYAPVVAGVQYTISADLMLLASTASAYVYIDIQYYAADKTTILLDGSQIFSYAGFDFANSLAKRRACSFTDTAPAGAAWAQVRVVCDPAGGTITAVGARLIKFERGAIATPYSQEAEARQQYLVRKDADYALAYRAGQLEATVNNPTTGVAATIARLNSTEFAKTTATDALAYRAGLLEATVNNPMTGVAATTARLNSTEFAKTTATDALAYRAGQLEATVNNPATGVAATTARLNSTEFAKTTATDALAYRAGQLEASRDGINARLNSTEFAKTTALDAMASSVSSLSVGSPNLLTVGGFVQGQTGWVFGSGAISNDLGWGPRFIASGISDPNGVVILNLHPDYWVPVTGNVDYTISADLMIYASTASAYVYVDVIYYAADRTTVLLDGGQTQLYASADFASSLAKRRAYAATDKAPANAAWAQMRVVCNPGGGTITAVGARLIKFERGAIATPYSQEAEARQQYLVQQTAEASLAYRAGQLEATVNNPTTGVAATTARLNSTEFAKTTATDALAYRAGELEATVNNPATGVAATTARLNSTEFAKTTATDALAYRAGQLEASRDGINARLNSTEFAKTTELNAVASSVSSLSVGSPNLISIGGFIAGLEGWNYNGSGWIADDLGWGPRFVALGLTGAPQPILSTQPDYYAPVVAGVQYTISADLMLLASTASAYVYIDIQYYAADKTTLILDGGQAFIYAGFDFANSLAKRRACSCTDTAPAGAAWAQVRVVCDPAGGTITAVGARLIKFERGAIATPYSQEAEARQQYLVRKDADSALAYRAGQLEATVNNPTTGMSATTARLNSTEFAKTTATDALAYRAGELEATVNNPATGVAATTARLNSTEFAKTTATDALAYRAGQLEASRDGINARLNSTEFAKTTATDALATSISGLSVGSPNLLAIGGFTAGLEGWNYKGSGIMADDIGWGPRFVDSAGISGAAWAILTTKPEYWVSVTSGATYTISADLLIFANTPNAYVYVDVLYYAADKTTIIHDGGQTPVHASADFASGLAKRRASAFTDTAPTGAAWAQVRVVCNPQGGTVGAVGARLIKFERGAIATDYSQEAEIRQQGTVITTLQGESARLDSKLSVHDASLSVQQAAINMLDGRNAAWLQINAVSGDNRAQVTIYADEEHAGIDLDASIRVHGPAIFDQSLTADKIVANGVTYMQQAYSAADHYGGAPTSGVVDYDDYGDPIYGSTDGSYRTLVSMTVTMDRAGDIMALAVAKQSYAGDGQSWQAVVRVNGNIVFQTGGIATADSISLMGKLAVGAGNHTVDFLWWSSGPLLQIRAGAASLATLRRYV